MPQAKTGLSLRQKLFVKNLLEGKSATQAFIQAGYSDKGSLQNIGANASRLKRTDRIQTYLKDCRESAFLAEQMSLAERRAYLASVARTPLKDITPDSPLCLEYSETTDAMGNVRRRAKKPNPVDAIRLDSMLAGDLDGSKSQVQSNPFLFLVALSKESDRLQGGQVASLPASVPTTIEAELV